jgi:hypothetical protein
MWISVQGSGMIFDPLDNPAHTFSGFAAGRTDLLVPISAAEISAIISRIHQCVNNRPTMPIPVTPAAPSNAAMRPKASGVTTGELHSFAETNQNQCYSRPDSSTIHTRALSTGGMVGRVVAQQRHGTAMRRWAGSLGGPRRLPF